jgi:hypothetical protein
MAIDSGPVPPELMQTAEAAIHADAPAVADSTALPGGATFSFNTNTVVLPKKPSVGHAIASDAKAVAKGVGHVAVAVVDAAPGLGTAHDFFACEHGNHAEVKNLRNRVQELNSSVAPDQKLDKGEVKDILANTTREKCGINALEGAAWDAVGVVTLGGGSLAKAGARMVYGAGGAEVINQVAGAPLRKAAEGHHIASRVVNAILPGDIGLHSHPSHAGETAFSGKSGKVYAFSPDDKCFVRDAASSSDACIVAGNNRIQQESDASMRAFADKFGVQVPDPSATDNAVTGASSVSAALGAPAAQGSLPSSRDYSALKEIAVPAAAPPPISSDLAGKSVPRNSSASSRKMLSVGL